MGTLPTIKTEDSDIDEMIVWSDSQVNAWIKELQDYQEQLKMIEFELNKIITANEQ